MTASDQNSRRAEKAELSRSITATETLAFMTALVAFLKEAEATTRHHDTIDVQPPADAPATHPVDPAPVDTAPAEHRPIPGDQHADAATPPTTETSMAPHGDAAAGGDSLHIAGATDVTAGSSGAIPASVAADGHSVASTDQGMVAADSTAHASATISAGIDPAGSLHDLGSSISGLVDTSLATVSHALDSLSSTLTQLTSSVAGTVGQLTDNVTGLVGGMLHSAGATVHDAAAHDIVDSLVADIVSSPLSPPQGDAAAHHIDINGLDTAGAVPMAALPPLTLHLGFVGQPTSDGHDLHDGAFSALGVHHF